MPKLLMEQIYDVEDQIKSETDSEVLELLNMDLADLQWLAGNYEGGKPSERWDEYKSEKGLTFDKVAA